MKYLMILVLMTTFFSRSALTQVDGVIDVIRDPSISRRCKSLIQDRNQKIKTHQRLNALLKRSKLLSKRVKKNQTSSRNRLESTTAEIENNIRLSRLRIKTMEEDIVRKGCPGISL